MIQQILQLYPTPWGLTPGMLPYGIAFVAMAFYLLGFLQIRTIRRYYPSPTMASNPFTQFFSIFGSLMLVLLITCFGYGYYAMEGLYNAMAEGASGAWFVLALGIIPLPFLAAELLTSHSQRTSDIGLLLPYQRNLESDDRWRHRLLRGEHGLKQWQTVQGSGLDRLLAISFVLWWTLYIQMVVISSYPLFCWKNFRINQGNLAKYPAKTRLFQAGLDILLGCSIVLQLLIVGMGLLLLLEQPFGRALLHSTMFVTSIKVSLTLLMFGVTLLLLWGLDVLVLFQMPKMETEMAATESIPEVQENQETRESVNTWRGQQTLAEAGRRTLAKLPRGIRWKTLLHLLYVLGLTGSLIVDMYYVRSVSPTSVEIGLSSLETTLSTPPLPFFLPTAYEDVRGIQGMRLLAGGAAPPALFFMMFYVFIRLQNEIALAWREVGQNIQTQLPFNLADQALHHFNNLLGAPQNALVQCQANLMKEVKEGLGTDLYTKEFLLRRIATGLTALNRATEVAGLLKGAGRVHRRNPEWHEFSDIWEDLQGRLTVITQVKTHFKAQVPADLWLHVDRTVLLDIITNLYNNAMDAIQSQVGKKEGIITISVAFEQKSRYPVKMIVEDNGPGVVEVDRNRIFDPYFSGKGKGSGLGLFVAREFMRSFNGDVELLPQKSGVQGAAFMLTFPFECVFIRT